MKNFFLSLMAFFTVATANAAPVEINPINDTLEDLAYMFNHEKKDPIYKLELFKKQKVRLLLRKFETGRSISIRVEKNQFR